MSAGTLWFWLSNMRSSAVQINTEFEDFFTSLKSYDLNISVHYIKTCFDTNAIYSRNQELVTAFPLQRM